MNNIDPFIQRMRERYLRQKKLLEEDPGRYYLENTPRGFPVTPYRPIKQFMKDIENESILRRNT